MQKEPVFLIKNGPKKGPGSSQGRTLLIFGGNLRAQTTRIEKTARSNLDSLKLAAARLG